MERLPTTPLPPLRLKRLSAFVDIKSPLPAIPSHHKNHLSRFEFLVVLGLGLSFILLLLMFVLMIYRISTTQQQQTLAGTDSFNETRNQQMMVVLQQQHKELVSMIRQLESRTDLLAQQLELARNDTRLGLRNSALSMAERFDQLTTIVHQSTYNDSQLYRAVLEIPSYNDSLLVDAVERLSTNLQLMDRYNDSILRQSVLNVSNQLLLSTKELSHEILQAQYNDSILTQHVLNVSHQLLLSTKELSFEILQVQYDDSILRQSVLNVSNQLLLSTNELSHEILQAQYNDSILTQHVLNVSHQLQLGKEELSFEILQAQYNDSILRQSVLNVSNQLLLSTNELSHEILQAQYNDSVLTQYVLDVSNQLLLSTEELSQEILQAQYNDSRLQERLTDLHNDSFWSSHLTNALVERSMYNDSSLRAQIFNHLEQLNLTLQLQLHELLKPYNDSLLVSQVAGLSSRIVESRYNDSGMLIRMEQLLARPFGVYNDASLRTELASLIVGTSDNQTAMLLNRISNQTIVEAKLDIAIELIQAQNGNNTPVVNNYYSYSTVGSNASQPGSNNTETLLMLEQLTSKVDSVSAAIGSYDDSTNLARATNTTYGATSLMDIAIRDYCKLSCTAPYTYGLNKFSYTDQLCKRIQIC
eukprot:TRINITY_DN125_c0_g1_i4.p1 TRINITY_DN125_c0_g1~~TRINITY_DN125_c0_g1_i4.p1  ORF type:complete len:643 (+),score=92.78 TRINITY_DN125_c0_g1_i4:3156-5084(+)